MLSRVRATEAVRLTVKRPRVKAIEKAAVSLGKALQPSMSAARSTASL